MSECKLCLQQKPLIKAHIIPQSFYATNNLLFSDSSLFTKKRPNGSYDSGILCQTCDGDVIGKFDTFAKKILIDRKGVRKETCHNPSNPQQALSFYRLEDKTGYDKLNKFFISVLWRASISSHEDFSSFYLGPYESLAKKIILDNSYDYSSIFSVILCWMSDSSERIQLVTSKFTKIEGVNFYTMLIGFCKVFIKVDKRRVPLGLRDSVLSAETDVLMLEGNLANFPEKKMLIEMVSTVQRNRKK